jgi:hypothetical protein
MVKPLDAERARVSMTVSRRLLDKLAAAGDALSHSHPGASEEQILEIGLDLILERQAKRRGLVKKPRKKAMGPPPPPSPRPGSRYIPASVRRAVWARDEGKCQFKLESGAICGGTRRIEYHHTDPFAQGGETTVEKLQLRCRPHNIAEARVVFGDDWMDRYTRPKGGGCSEPVAAYGENPDPTSWMPGRAGYSSRSTMARKPEMEPDPRVEGS